MPEVTQAHLDAIQRVLDAIGSAWRGDWSEFDGRTLRDQLGGLVGQIACADDPGAAADETLRNLGINPETWSWAR